MSYAIQFERPADEAQLLHVVDVDYWPCTPAPIRPLVDALTFITDKRHWGTMFRYGQIRIGAQDFALIAHAMGCDVDQAWAAPPSVQADLF